MQTRIINKTSYDKTDNREIFNVDGAKSRLKVYIKNKLTVYDVPVVTEALVEKEEFCASKFTFYVLKDSSVSFDQGDAVSVKYDDAGIFYGYVFSKYRDKDNLIKVVCYDQMRYMKNRRTYTRGSMTLSEAVRRIASEYSLNVGDIDSCNTLLKPVAADNVSLLDVVRKACKDVREISGERFILYDDCGRLNLKNEAGLAMNTVIDPSQAENFIYSDTIDRDTYNMIQIYNDTKRLNIREVTTVSDKETMGKWGALMLSRHTTEPENAYTQAKNLLKEYNRINRTIVLKTVKGDAGFIPGCSVYLKMTMGDLYFDRYVRVKKVIHKFKNGFYSADIYIDGSEVE